MQGRDKFNLARENLARTKASTQDILGIESKPRVQSKWARHHQHLLKLREQLLAKKEALAQDVNADRESPLFGEHMADAATDSYDRDWALSMLSSGQSAFYEVEQALQRIRYGSYGICEFTGKPIEPDRLLAIPWARFSAAAQRELESKGVVSRTHLGELGTFSAPSDQDSSEEEPVPAGATEKSK